MYETNVVDMLVHMFKVDMCQACLVWKRHIAAILPFKNPIMAIEQLLRSIPTDTLPFDIVLWLRHFLPIVAQIHPANVAQMTDWCVEKTHALQYDKRWPQIGLEFITNIVNIFSKTSDAYPYVRYVIGETKGGGT